MAMLIGQDSLKTRRTLEVNGKQYTYFSIKAAAAAFPKAASLPYSLKVLLENLLRFEDGNSVSADDIAALANVTANSPSREIAYRPARVLMQDFTGVPALADLAAMRAAIAGIDGDSNKINPLVPVDLVIDHSVQVDIHGSQLALQQNVELEMERNLERYMFLRWGQQSFHNLQVVPPGTGICHQVNLEYLAKGVWHSQQNGLLLAYPDTLVGTDSHTTMINGLGVLGWGVGGIEAEAAMLGQPISMLLPEVIGFKLTGKLREGITATDLVLTITQILRQKGVVGKFVEFYGAGLLQLTVADRATVANMAPEYGATCGFFPIDKATINYLALTGRSAETIALVEAYTKAQGLWYDENSEDPEFATIVELDLASVEPSLAGPKRPQDRVTFTQMPKAFNDILTASDKEAAAVKVAADGEFMLKNGDVVIAAITSCTNTSNPSVLIAAGLLAKKALAKGLTCKPWVKASLAPGSKVVTQYLQKTGLQQYLDALGFYLVGYGCTTCIGNSGPLLPTVAQAVDDGNLVVSAVLSGNRNFEGRIHPQVKANWLASPPIVVALALAGTVCIDLTQDAISQDAAGNKVFLRDIWPTNAEIASAMADIDSEMFLQQYRDVFKGDSYWQNIAISSHKTYLWDEQSTYIRKPPFFQGFKRHPSLPQDISNARILALFGDSITTDHISPAGAIKADSPAGKYLIEHGIAVKDFNSYGARRGNHEIMMRGTFANIRIRNMMVPGVEGGVTRHIPSGDIISIYDAAMRYKDEGTPLVIVAGKEYGTGSSRDWAAKGPKLLGVTAVIAESFERIHRTNLVGMGILPLEFIEGMTHKTLQLDGTEVIDITGIDENLQPRAILTATIKRQDSSQQIRLLCRIDTKNEKAYYCHGGILHYVLRSLVN